MNKYSVILLVALLFLVGCVQVPSEQMQSQRSSQLAISSVRDLPLSYPLGSRFFIKPIHVPSKTVTQQQIHPAYKRYTQALITRLEPFGYRYVVSDNADFEVGFALALERDLNDSTINEKFGNSPGLHKVDQLEKGSFLVYVKDIATDKGVWRGAAQGFVQDDFTQQQGQQRAESVVETVLKQFLQK